MNGTETPTEIDKKEARRLKLVAEAAKLERRQDAADYAKEFWRNAKDDEDAELKRLKKVREDSRQAMDVAFALVGDSQKAEAELLNEFVPLELRRKAADAAAAVGKAEAELGRLADSHKHLKEQLKFQEKRGGYDSEMKATEHQRLAQFDDRGNKKLAEVGELKAVYVVAQHEVLEALEAARRGPIANETETDGSEAE